jgi:hypothetical protein
MKIHWFSLSVLALSIALVAFTPKKDGGNSTSSLTVEDKQNIVFFKTMRNANRVTVFERLQTKLKIKQANTINMQPSTFADVVSLFGEPNINIKNTTLIYTLNPSNGCKAYIVLDAQGLVTYCATRDCN